MKAFFGALLVACVFVSVSLAHAAGETWDDPLVIDSLDGKAALPFFVDNYTTTDLTTGWTHDHAYYIWLWVLHPGGGEIPYYGIRSQTTCSNIDIGTEAWTLQPSDDYHFYEDVSESSVVTWSGYDTLVLINLSEPGEVFSFNETHL